MRQASMSRKLYGGCYQCHGDEAHWFGVNTQGVAARHHDATGHTTWVEIAISIRYGEPEVEAEQLAFDNLEGI